MRPAIMLFCLCLVACAAPQTAGQYYFQGVYVPGEAAIDMQGGFVTRASVWEAAQMPVAQRAALSRLKRAAEARGYEFFIPDDAQISDGGGNQFLMTGRLFRRDQAPGNAMPIDLLEIAAAGAAAEPHSAIPADATQNAASPAEAAPAEATPAEATPAAGTAPAATGEPLVIRAPDFG